MTVGKNQSKKAAKGRKGTKKKAQDPFSKKEWYDIKAPNYFKKNKAGTTLITKTQGTKIASEGLKGRVFEVNLADLNENEDQAHRKMKLVAEDVRGTEILTNFHGMDLTREKLNSMIKKWQSLIEAQIEAKTTDNYTLRVFVIGFTMNKNARGRHDLPQKTTCYAQAAQIRAIRKKMTEIVTNYITQNDLKELVKKFIPEQVGTDITRATKSIFPLQNVFVRKVKVLKKPKYDLNKLMEVYQETGDETGEGVARPEDVGPVAALVGSGGRL